MRGKRLRFGVGAGVVLMAMAWFRPALADYAFTNALAEATAAEKRGDVAVVLKLYGEAKRAEANDAGRLCVLSRRYCELTYLTNAAIKAPEMVRLALDCALAAVRANTNDAEAHASLAVCYAKSCSYVDIKTQLAYSRLFKQEAETALALDPRQDIAYYLLGRWNYAIANVGLFSRAYVKLVYGGLPPASNAEAIADFKKAIALAPQRVIHHAGLAMAYGAAGQKKIALAELRVCLAMPAAGPEDEEAKRDAAKALGQTVP